MPTHPSHALIRLRLAILTENLHSGRVVSKQASVATSIMPPLVRQILVVFRPTPATRPDQRMNWSVVDVLPSALWPIQRKRNDRDSRMARRLKPRHHNNPGKPRRVCFERRSSGIRARESSRERKFPEPDRVASLSRKSFPSLNIECFGFDSNFRKYSGYWAGLLPSTVNIGRNEL